MNIVIAAPDSGKVSETFILAHTKRLTGVVGVVTGTLQPEIDGRPVLSASIPARAWRMLQRKARGQDWQWEVIAGQIAALRRLKADVVLAEYGTQAVRWLEACQHAGVPLVAHFHGFDASCHNVFAQHRESYPRMFQQAAAVVAVSQAMRKRLVVEGCPTEKIVLNPYGVDCERFAGANPSEARPQLLAVGRFVEKKAPQLTLMAFAEALKEVPAARLRMIGEGPLLGPCKDIVQGWGMDNAVEFLGGQSHQVVMEEMQQARAFVQHSVEATDGDCEGTPVAILEAGAAGLPVIATRHAGIPDVVIDGDTGLLLDERDVPSMTEAMCELLKHPDVAGRMGAAAARHIRANHTMDRSIDQLATLLKAAATASPLPEFHSSIEAANAKRALEV